MEPKNAAERKKAFTNFLLLFCLCILLVMITGFFSVQVPFSENEKLKTKMAQLDREKEFSEKFTIKMKHVSVMLDSINITTPQEADRLEGRIKNEIDKLNLMVSDSMNKQDLYDLYIFSVHNIEDLQRSLKELRSKSGNDADVNLYKAQLEEAKQKAQDNYEKYLEKSKDLIECISTKKNN